MSANFVERNIAFMIWNVRKRKTTKGAIMGAFYVEGTEYYEVEIITKVTEFGTFRKYKNYKPAKMFAEQRSMQEGIIECSLMGFDKWGEQTCHEYYKNGKMSIKVL